MKKRRVRSKTGECLTRHDLLLEANLGVTYQDRLVCFVTFNVIYKQNSLKHIAVLRRYILTHGVLGFWGLRNGVPYG